MGASTCRRGWEFPGEFAARARTFPGLDFPELIHLGEVKNSAAGGAIAENGAARVEFAVNPVRVAGRVTKHPRAIAPLAAVVRPDFLLIFLQHHSPHRGVVEIAQRRELLPGGHDGIYWF